MSTRKERQALEYLIMEEQILNRQKDYLQQQLNRLMVQEVQLLAARQKLKDQHKKSTPKQGAASSCLNESEGAANNKEGEELEKLDLLVEETVNAFSSVDGLD